MSRSSQKLPKYYADGQTSVSMIFLIGAAFVGSLLPRSCEAADTTSRWLQSSDVGGFGSEPVGIPIYVHKRHVTFTALVIFQATKYSGRVESWCKLVFTSWLDLQSARFWP